MFDFYCRFLAIFNRCLTKRITTKGTLRKVVSTFQQVERRKGENQTCRVIMIANNSFLMQIRRKQGQS